MPRAGSGRGRRGELAGRPRAAGGSEPFLRGALSKAVARAGAGLDSALGSHYRVAGARRPCPCRHVREPAGPVLGVS